MTCSLITAARRFEQWATGYIPDSPAIRCMVATWWIRAADLHPALPAPSREAVQELCMKIEMGDRDGAWEQLALFEATLAAEEDDLGPVPGGGAGHRERRD